MNPAETKDIRDAFFDEVYDAAVADQRVIVLVDDQGAFALNRLREEFPERYINIGIAEQNLINVAAGLAMEGWKPVVYGINNFVSLRCCEQISVALAYPNLPVTIVASGGGLTYASDGPTHHGLHDIAVLRSLPNFTVLNPSDAELTRVCARLCLDNEGPFYVRMERGVVPALHSGVDSFESGIARLLEGNEVLLLSTGFITHVAFEAAQLLRDQGVECGLVEVFKLRLLAGDVLWKEIKDSHILVVVEEQPPIGGLRSVVGELPERFKGKIMHCCLPEEPSYIYGSRDWIRASHGLDAVSIFERVRASLLR